MTFDSFWLGRGAAALLLTAAGIAGHSLFGRGAGAGRRGLLRYVARLENQLGYVRAKIRGRTIACIQGGALALVLGASFLGSFLGLFAAPVVLVGPSILIERRSASRTRRIEEQVETWLNAIANALKASASVGEAIGASVPSLSVPISEEVSLVLKECELGTPLDVALDNMANRIPSKTLKSTILALKIARRSGGNLPETLETAAATLREMARLEGVVRTKTAEGKAQAFVIGLIPIPMVLLIHFIDPRFFEPLSGSLAGQGILGAAGILWAVAVLSARRILDVDI